MSSTVKTSGAPASDSKTVTEDELRCRDCITPEDVLNLKSITTGKNTR
jgi:hypothetical protein